MLQTLFRDKEGATIKRTKPSRREELSINRNQEHQQHDKRALSQQKIKLKKFVHAETALFPGMPASCAVGDIG